MRLVQADRRRAHGRVRGSALLGLFVATLLASKATPAANAYTEIDGPRPGNDPETIEVREFFWYGCPHCNDFRPHIAQWKASKPDGVAFEHVPAVFRPSWAVHARAFYAAKISGVLDQFHEPMFRAIHDEGRKLDSQQAIGAFVDELGLDSDAFIDTMSSFAVNTRVERAKKLQQAYGVRATPTVVVDGRYRVSPNKVGSFEGMIRVINERVAALRDGGG
jgi:thiol:disulfide interchange protein DsbA